MFKKMHFALLSVRRVDYIVRLNGSVNSKRHSYSTQVAYAKFRCRTPLYHRRNIEVWEEGKPYLAGGCYKLW